MSIDNYFKTQKHLPPFLRDFHDQKDFFKAMHEYFAEQEAKHPNKYPKGMIRNTEWAEGMCYTIDRFLKFMMFHGYKLQKDRSKGPFFDIHQTIAEFGEIRAKILTEALNQSIREAKCGLTQNTSNLSEPSLLESTKPLPPKSSSTATESSAN